MGAGVGVKCKEPGNEWELDIQAEKQNKYILLKNKKGEGTSGRGRNETGVVLVTAVWCWNYSPPRS